MGLHYAVIFFLLIRGFIADAEHVKRQPGPPPLQARCRVSRNTNADFSDTQDVTGDVRLEQFPGGPTQIRVHLSGLSPDSTHGFHVHTDADPNNDCDNNGGHYNPYSKDHGAPTDTNRHVGDLGNVVADSQGRVNVVLQDDQVQLSGETSVIGRSFVIHADEDDLGLGGFSDSLTTGHAGARLACCTIESWGGREGSSSRSASSRR